MIFTHRLTLVGQPQQLPTVLPKFAEVMLATPSTNSGTVYLAASPVTVKVVSNRFAIAAGKELPFKITDLSQLWADGTAADVLDILCEVEKEQ